MSAHPAQPDRGHRIGRAVLRTYLRIGWLTGLIALAVGLSSLATVVMSYLFGSGFSYYDLQMSRGIPMDGPYLAPDPRALDVVHGTTAVIVGTLFAVAHWWGTRYAESDEERWNSVISRLTTLAGAVIFGVTAVIGLVSGIAGALDRALVTGSDDRPGPPLGTGIVFALGWAYFMVMVVRHLRRASNQDKE